MSKYYDEKIITLYKNIGGLGGKIIEYVESIQMPEDRAGGSVAVTAEEWMQLKQYATEISNYASEFNYFTEFYPNKKERWSHEISNVNQLLDYINKMNLLN